MNLSNKDKRFELAVKYLSSNEIPSLVLMNYLLSLNKIPKWNDEAAKKKLIRIF